MQFEEFCSKLSDAVECDIQFDNLGQIIAYVDANADMDANLLLSIAPKMVVESTESPKNDQYIIYTGKAVYNDMVVEFEV